MLTTRFCTRNQRAGLIRCVDFSVCSPQAGSPVATEAVWHFATHRTSVRLTPSPVASQKANVSMPVATITDPELLAYLDEMLPAERASLIERELRDSPALRQRASILARRRDQGGHSVGEIWRRHRLSCLTRSQLGSYVLGTLDQHLTDYIEFHLRTIGCRICAANLQDLQSARQASTDARQRRRKFFESSAGLLSSR